jgi:ketosteroid isomerase-like protein
MIDGTRHENTVADVFTIQDGRVVEMVAYADPDAVPVE